jgi:hypothetical protein
MRPKTLAAGRTPLYQQVNQFAQPTVIAAIGHRPGKRTIHAAANRTSPETIVVAPGIGGKDALPANGTNLSTHRMDAGEAIGTNGQPGKVRERLGANAAV